MFPLKGVVESLVGGDALLRFGFGVLVGVGIGDLICPVVGVAFRSTSKTVSTSGRDGSLGRRKVEEGTRRGQVSFRMTQEKPR